MTPLLHKIQQFFVTPEVTEEIAIAHDYLTQKGGAERVVLALHKAFPEAKIYTTLYEPEGTFPEFADADIVTSPLNRFGFLRRNHRYALPLLPFASSLLKVPAKKTIVSSTGWAHGFNFAGESFIYCHSPARWLYLSDQYLGNNESSFMALALKSLLPILKFWDQRAAKSAGEYVANSTTIQQRIKEVYGKNVDIIFPPFSLTADSDQRPVEGLEDFLADGNYYLLVSRLMPYKNIDQAVKAFSMTDKKLLVIGSGPMADELQAMSNDNVRFAANIPDDQLRYAYVNCIALLAVSYEDFGLTPLEAGSYGKPTIALKSGGYLDTIREGINGVYIEHPTAENIFTAVNRFNADSFDSEAIREYVQRFSEQRFIEHIKSRMNNL